MMEKTQEESTDLDFFRGYLWSLIPSLMLWAAVIYLAFSVF